METRLEKKLLERENWYKISQGEEDTEESPTKKRRIDLKTSSKTWKAKNPRKKILRNEKTQVRSVIFVPYTNQSGLAKELREKESKLENITGDKIKIVERGGRKLEDLIASKDPWKGNDCGRENCFLCSTKMLTGKQSNRDCTKRNILYEIKCITCEDVEKEKIDEICGEDEKRKKEMEKQLQIPQYIGESSRSAFERGFEHLNNLARLSSHSHMLRHHVTAHEGLEFEDVKWGMSILDYKRSAFERQLSEAVLITAEAAKNQKILNERSERSQSALPSLVSRIGSKEAEIKAFEKEIEEEKKIDDVIEEKIRNLRKRKNKARLIRETNTQNKRQKTSNENHISVRDTWGKPDPVAPKKHLQEDIDGNERKKLKIDKERSLVSEIEKTDAKPRSNVLVQSTDKYGSEKLVNNERIEDKIMEGPAITDFKIIENSKTEWDEKVRKHREKI